MTDIDRLTAQFTELYGSPPEFVVRAPGRVNLIGEHTDYNDGYVFPAAIDRDIAIAGSSRTDSQVRAYSVTFKQSSTFRVDDIRKSEDAPWSNYIRGMARMLKDEGFEPGGLNLAVDGTVPIGSGLSSSAALEISACIAFEAGGGFKIPPVKRALIGQRTEREFVGVQSGIMDQFISALGQVDHALFIDTRTLDYAAVPLPAEGVALVVCDTNKQRGLVDSEYNTRRKECEEAVRLLARFLPGIRALRDVDEEQFTQYGADLPEPVRRRAKHVVTEDARVLQGVDALKSGDVALFGQLMDRSHESLRDDFQVSCKELDTMVELARQVPGTFGSRMTGAGFGGCTISLVRTDAVEEFKRHVAPRYKAATGLEAAIYVCRASAGARRER